MDFSEILNLALGGGLLASVVSIITLRATLRKAHAEAERAHAEADTVKLTNTEHATRILMEHIVEPLKQDLDETRKDLNSTKREMARLRKAIDDANSCKYSADCPVLHRMRQQSKERVEPEQPDAVLGQRGRHRRRQRKRGDGASPDLAAECADAGAPDAGEPSVGDVIDEASDEASDGGDGGLLGV